MLEYVVEQITSRHLAGNRVGDSPVRNLVVQLPPGYHQSGARYPVVYHLHGFGDCALNFIQDFRLKAGPRWRCFRDMAAESIESGRSAPMIHVFPDGVNRWGCSQWVGNAVQGDYDRYVAEEVVDLVDAQYRTLPSAASRGLVGLSSGGSGTFHIGARHPDVFGALAIQSADIYMEATHVPWLVRAVNSSYPEGMRGPLPAGDTWTWYAYGMALAYSPNPDAPYYVDLPVTFPEAELVPEVWERWLGYDPIRAVYPFAENLRRCRGIYLDVGTHDEHDLHLGHRILSRRMAELHIAHEHHEHDGSHANREFDRLELIHQWFSRTLANA